MRPRPSQVSFRKLTPKVVKFRVPSNFFRDIIMNQGSKREVRKGNEPKQKYQRRLFSGSFMAPSRRHSLKKIQPLPNQP